jgi:predicted ArsR family transcriptional regulator
MQQRISLSERRARILTAIDAGKKSLMELAESAGITQENTRLILDGMERERIVILTRGTSPYGRPINTWDRLERKGELEMQLRQPKIRTCLSCQMPFLSPHAGVRRCNTCKAAEARAGSAGVFDTPVFIHH